LFACADDENGDEQNDEIASRAKEIRAACSEAGQNDAIASPTAKICEACSELRQNDTIASPAAKICEAYNEAAHAVHALLLPQPLRLFNLRIWSAATCHLFLYEAIPPSRNTVPKRGHVRALRNFTTRLRWLTMQQRETDMKADATGD